MLLRVMHIAAIGSLVASAVYAYSIKYEATFYAEEAAQLRVKLQRERDTIAVMRAEWQRLNRPERLQTLAERHLDLQPMAVNQIVRLSDIPERKPRADAIGAKLEALGLALPTDTPRDPRAGDARTPGSSR